MNILTHILMRQSERKLILDEYLQNIMGHLIIYMDN